ncbi:MAG: hypothetical protein JO291_16475 [Acidimicrobiia bacterium]|nr:hypothetical protein [Acidimicrobiia bacterium]
MPRPTVDGYCWPQSVVAGEPVALHVAASVPSVDVEVARIGARREVVDGPRPLTTEDHPVPADASAHGCNWPVALELDTTGWRSGYHEVQLTARADDRTTVGRAFVVVRPSPTSDRRVLWVLGTSTWHAYNDFAGTNLYNGGTQASLLRPMAPGYLYKPPGHGRRVATTHPPDPQMAAHVGYLRLNHLSEWAGSAGWPNWEHPFAVWAERNGYEMDVASSADLEDPELLSRYRLLLSIGHDEYWSGPMRNSVEAFIAAGGNVAFLSGNTSFWQVRFEDDGTTMVGYKARFRDDPCYRTDRHAETTTMWCDHELGRPEAEMTGVSFSRGGYHRIGKRVTNGLGGYTVHRPDHWLFEGTGLTYGDVLGASSTVVGYECDGCDFTYRDGLPYPTGVDGSPEGFEILGTAPAAPFTRTTSARPPRGRDMAESEFTSWRLLGERGPEAEARILHGHAVLGTYTQGGTVVTSGSTEWVHGLAERDPQIEQITANILERLG